MDVIEVIKKDKAYKKCKLIVKTWEKDFKLKYSRTPCKFDIKEAPDKIKYAYKKYFQLKSAALDRSLNVSDLDQDEFVSLELSQHDDNLALEVPSPDSEQLMQMLPSGQQLEELLLHAKKMESKPNVKSEEEIKPLSPFTNNLSKKLFESRKFSIRNPRKLSMQSQKSTTCEDRPNPDYTELMNSQSLKNKSEESTLSLKAFERNANGTERKSSILYSWNPAQVRHISEAWLDRASGSNVDKEKVEPKIETFGMRNIKTTAVEKPNDFVENSESDTEDSNITKIKPALKKRKISHTRAISISDIKQGNSRNLKPNIETNHYPDLCDTSKSRKSKTKVSVKHLNHEELPEMSDFLPFGAEQDVTPRHADVSSVLKNIENCEKDLQFKDTQHQEADKLDIKIKNGTLNENFVKINIEKKVYARGKKHINFSKYKKQLWKDKKALHGGMEFPESGKINCFKCGEHGHMARYCTAHKGDTLLPLMDCDEDSMPTLEDMKNIVTPNSSTHVVSTDLINSIYQPCAIPDTFLKLLSETNSIQNNYSEVKPITETEEETTNEVYDVLHKFGHDKFRSGQERAINRILSGKSTLLLLSTGGGKSLCYQIPAYIYSQHYKCITLVISPLVSLMEDQVLSMPDFLKAGCLHTNQPPTQRQKIMQHIKDGELNILLISPEALISGDISNGFGGLFKSLPPIAFACIDEAHCVSQWSHNFRPSYLMICRVLREKLNVKCILGLTATASQSTIKSIIDHINIPDGLAGVITNPALPDNLILTVSFEKDKDRALVTLLATEKLNAYKSIIVYCIRRDECERIAAILRSALQEPGNYNMEAQTKKRKRMSYIAEAYHAGMSAAQRKKIQKHFMEGTLRIIVATVAFGMGINKSDIRCIIHYNMPSSFESYVQEVGRAGRDGKDAHCHVFMSKSNSNDKNELLKHIHANTIDRPMIRKLIKKICIPCECIKVQINSQQRCKGHEVGIPIDATVEELDIAAENISTLLCYLELHPKKYIKVLNNAYTFCKIISYGGPRKILEAAKTCPPLAMAYVIESKRNTSIIQNNVLEFNVIEVAAAIGWDSGMVKYRLKNLEWISTESTSKRSQLKVEFNTIGFRIKAPGDLAPAELDKMLDDLHSSVVSQEKAMLHQLEEISKAFSKIGNYSMEGINDCDEHLHERSQELKSIIRKYFDRTDIMHTETVLEERPLDEEKVRADVRALIVSYKDCNFTGRSIARIFQGISSPNFPAIVWGRCKFWRSHTHEDFYGLIKIATQELIQMKLN